MAIHPFLPSLHDNSQKTCKLFIYPIYLCHGLNPLSSYGFKRIFEAHDMYRPGTTSSPSPSVSHQAASRPISASLAYGFSSCPFFISRIKLSFIVNFRSRTASVSSSTLTSLAGYYRLVTPYRLLLVPGNRSDLRSPNTKIAVSSGAMSVFSSPFTHSRSAIRWTELNCSLCNASTNSSNAPKSSGASFLSPYFGR